MAQTDTEIKFSIEKVIKAFSCGNLTENSLKLFQVLGYNTERQQPLPEKSFACFKEYYIDTVSSFNEEKALAKEWQQIDLLFQLTKEEVTGQNSLFDTTQVDRTIIEAYLFFCIELNDREYTRTALSQITREINKVFKMPVMVLFKLGNKLSLAIINRRLHKKDAEKDVLEKVTLIKDINIQQPHRAHIEILFDLTIEELRHVHKFTNFVELHEAWKKTLDTKELNKRFYKELSNWYFWAIKEVYFPGEPFQANAATDPQVREHNAKNLIRLLTRLLFVWFVKEKNLVPDQLFDKRFIKDSLLNGFDPAKTSTFDDHAKASRYYRAVLQNLFFASLNQVVGKREFRKQGQHMNVTNLMRYESYFKDPQAFVALIDNVVPFMNGGLFECLDKPDPQKKGKQGGDVIIYEDGFSDRADNTLCVPDYIFFSNSEHADLSSELDDKKQSNVTVRGLINILNDYKFTVTENTPIEEDIALDPELLGRVFENLLASYNPETKTTARKQTGSFYTPREIVDYMVDESLKAYLKQKLVAVSGMKEEDAVVGLNILFSYTEKEHAFNDGEKQVLIEAIDACKVLDPACGSGAFPMGILHKLVHVLHKLDPDNELWRDRQRQNAIKQTEDAFRIGNQEERENRLKDISDVFENNACDYGRKLYLIENCINGVDIQPIATQISKLRFFISLIVEQHSNNDKAHNYGVIPLPNLETKFVAANSLIGLKKPEHQINCFDNQTVKNIEELIQHVRHKLFSAKTPETKRKLREKDDALRKQLRDLLIMNGLGNDTAHQLAAWDPYDQNARSPFFDMEWMFGVKDGFDIVIGNPPYIGQKNNNIVFQEVKKSQLGVFHQRRMDYFYFFFHEALNITKRNGILGFITTNYFLTATYADILRKDIRDRATLIQLVNFNEYKIFESATGQHNIITIMSKGYCENAKVNCCTVYEKGGASTECLQNILGGISNNVIRNEILNKDIYEGDSSYIQISGSCLSNTLSNAVFEKISFMSRPLGEIYSLVEGIHTGADKVSESHIEKYKLDIPKGKGIYVLSKHEIDNLKLTDKERSIIKPWYKNSDISRWVARTSSNKFLIYYTTKSSFCDFEIIQKYLSQFKLILVNRKTRSGTGIISVSNYDEYVAGKRAISYVMNASAFKSGNYYCISYPRENYVFDGEKIVVPQRSMRNTFAYNKEPWYASADVYFIISKNEDYDLKYLLGILNSKLIYYWLYNKGKRKGDALELYIRPLSEIPIKITDKEKQQPIVALVSRILSAKTSDCNADIKEMEGELNSLVNKLYCLSDEEINYLTSQF